MATEDSAPGHLGSIRRLYVARCNDCDWRADTDSVHEAQALLWAHEEETVDGNH